MIEHHKPTEKKTNLYLSTFAGGQWIDLPSFLGEMSGRPSTEKPLKLIMSCNFLKV